MSTSEDQQWDESPSDGTPDPLLHDLERFLRVAEINGEWVWELDSQGRYVYCSPSVRAVLGYAPEEMEGRHFSAFVATPHREGLAELLDSVRREGRPHSKAIAQHVHQDGHLVSTETLCIPVLTGTGDVERILGAHRDVSREAELEAELRHSQKMEAVGRLAGGIAHDFNNLLTTVLGCCNLLKEDLAESDAAFEDLQMIEQAGTRAARLTQQLLAFSCKQILEIRRLNLNDLVGGMADLLGRTLGEDIDLQLRPSPELPDIEADADQLRQVVLHLAINAREAMVEGTYYQPDLWSMVGDGENRPNGVKRLTLETKTVTVDGAYARHHPGVASGTYALLIVSDTGVGMPEHVKQYIFEPFFTTKGVGEGSGLGLSTVYGIVRQMGGEIDVKSAPGQGTAFHIYLPSIRAESVAPARGPAPAKETLHGAESVLIVEDDDKVRELLARMLEAFGYRTTQARDGAEGLELCQAENGPIDLVVTDMVMPRMTGKQFIEAARLHREDLKVLYISGYSREDVVDGQTLGMGADFIQKPFTRDQFVERVRRLLDAP